MPALLPAVGLALALVAADAAAPGAFDRRDAEARLKFAHQLARELNDRALVDRIESAGERLKRLVRDGQTDEVERELREVEKLVGIDPGGWSMGGLPVFHPSPEMLAALGPLGPALAEAMRAGDVGAVVAVVERMRGVLGDQAGVPDGRRPGLRAERRRVTDAEAAEVFLAALDKDRAALREIAAGRPVGKNMLRMYAQLVAACLDARPLVERHAPDRLPDLDRLVRGAARILVERQQPAGFFPFPDLRGVNVRFGAMAEKLAAAEPDAIRDGWIVVPDPQGGSQFDTGECGVALLRAGAAYDEPTWTAAGLRAADWALGQPCVPNFNYNAFSVGLLAHAFRSSGRRAYLDGAMQKFRVGVAPGQLASGRWVDAHNARIVYHLILVRSLNDLYAALPADEAAARAEVRQVLDRAVAAVLDEFERAGVTNGSFPLRELVRYEQLVERPDPRLRAAIEETASVAWEATTRPRERAFGFALSELAALGPAWPEGTR